ncbi:MAG: ATP-binding protein [Sediminibacterium sp.]
MKPVWKSFVLRNGYLLITAAWLYTLSFLFSNYWSYRSSPVKVKSTLERQLSGETDQIERISVDSLLILSLIKADQPVANPIKGETGIFLYEGHSDSRNTRLLYWNSNEIYVDAKDLNLSPGIHFVVHRNGDFQLIRKNLVVKGNPYTLMAYVPIRWHFFIENKYLRTDFAGLEHLEEQYTISDAPGSIAIHSSNGQPLFKIMLKSGREFIEYDMVTVLLRLLAILCLLAFLHNISSEWVRMYSFQQGFLFLFGSVTALRVITYRFHVPFDFSKIPLFDPGIYASNIIHPSLGDLLVNAALVYWLLRFYRSRRLFPLMTNSEYTRGNRTWFNSFILAFCGLFLASIVSSLLEDAKISFDVSNFFSLSLFSCISFIILCLLVLIFYYFSEILMFPLLRNRPPLIWQLPGIVIAGCLFIYLQREPETVLLYASITGWIIFYLLLVYLRREEFIKGLSNSAFYIFWVMFFALSIATLVMFRFRQVEWLQREKLAEHLANRSDPFGENLLSIAATNFDDRWLELNYQRFSQNELENKILKDSLIRQNFSGYLNKFDTRILTFNAVRQPLFNDDSVRCLDLDTLIELHSTSTGIDALFIAGQDNKLFNYAFRKTVADADNILGYVYVLIKATRYKSEALYPELFNQATDPLINPASGYSYAVYNNEKLSEQYGNYSFSTSPRYRKNNAPLFRYDSGEFSELWLSNETGKQIMIARRNNTLLELMTLFAYLFCAFLLISFVFDKTALLLTTAFRKKQLRTLFQIKIRSQLQAIIIFISIFSFFVISITTITLFINRFNQNNEERLSRSIQVMANEINSRTASLESIELQGSPDGFGNQLQQVITDISDQHNADINFYSTWGNLLISTQPYIYNKKLLSEKMNAEAFQQLTKNKSIRFQQTEKIGSFRYLSVYQPLTDASGSTYAFLNIPYLNTQTELNQEISGFLAAILNLNAFIFLIAGIIAFYFTSRISESFELITRKMQQISLGKVNETIEWNRNDELGLLISEYNKMVKKLEASASALAVSEREVAWREMARQVAHEIKNPLTPMKLSIQYLQDALQKDDPRLPELYQKTTATLLTQIDQLSRIASDFSQYAQISMAKSVPLDISEVIRKWTGLYELSDNCRILLILPDEPMMIKGDQSHLDRLFTNLLLNSIQACQEGEIANISVRIEGTADFIAVSFSDQSGGIAPDVIINMFSPNFTTKSSGTGLGLAICKRIVEQAGGSIRFETEWGSGTTFIMQWPRWK